MASRLNPYFSFDGNAREAMEFYRDVFGGELKITTFGEAGAASDGNADQVMHAMLETPSGYTVMASDNPPGAQFKPGSTISISVSGDDAAELQGYWKLLSESGSILMPLEKQMWGDDFGMCVDRFGIIWMVDIVGSPQG